MKKLKSGALVFGLAVLFALPLAFLLEPQETPVAENPKCPQLKAEFCEAVVDSFNLARALYVQGKYEVCLSEIAKVHKITPAYENSRELQLFCEQGRELVMRQREIEAKERKAREEAQANIEIKRKPASAGSYICKRVTVAQNYGFENYLNSACNRSKPFAISPLIDDRHDFHVCCIAK